MDTAKPPSGRDIWAAIKTEMMANLYELPTDASQSIMLPPTSYHVYLHPEDYAFVEGIVPRIEQENANALTREVSRINADAGRRRRWNPIRTRAVTTIEMPAGGWEIYVRPDQDGELQRGQLGVISKLTMPTHEYSGTPTVLTTQAVFSGGQRTAATVSHEAAPPANPVETSPIKADKVTATLSYTDDDGPHTFIITKSPLKIGRGGEGVWVDVQVAANARVSREHCWVVYESGRVFVQDVSSWGTAVNGEPTPQPQRSNGQVTTAGARKELKSGDRIELAGTLNIVFRSERQP